MKRFRNVEEVLRVVEAHFVPEQAKGVDLTGQLHLTGEGGGDWVLRIQNERLQVEPGTTDAPDAMRLSASVENFMAVANGEMDATRAYFTGKIHFKGSLRQAYHILDLFRMPGARHG